MLQQHLKAAGFTVQAGVAEMPTAFIASFGEGKPVIGLLGEFDALPGLSQDAVPERKALVANAPGHGCGHNLLGAAGRSPPSPSRSTWPAITFPARSALLRYAGRRRRLRQGLHGACGPVPGCRRGAALAPRRPQRRHDRSRDAGHDFRQVRISRPGRSAAAAPEMGRSALDGVMLMGNAVEFLREHVPSSTRIHYIISKGGVAPNVVPDDAEMFLYARHPSMPILTGIWDRIVACAQGTAQATGTTVDVRIVSSDYNLIDNSPLAERMYRNLSELGGIAYTPAETDFAARLTRPAAARIAAHGGRRKPYRTVAGSRFATAGIQRSGRRQLGGPHQGRFHRHLGPPELRRIAGTPWRPAAWPSGRTEWCSRPKPWRLPPRTCSPTRSCERLPKKIS